MTHKNTIIFECSHNNAELSTFSNNHLLIEFENSLRSDEEQGWTGIQDMFSQVAILSNSLDFQ